MFYILFVLKILHVFFYIHLLIYVCITQTIYNDDRLYNIIAPFILLCNKFVVLHLTLCAPRVSNLSSEPEKVEENRMPTHTHTCKIQAFFPIFIYFLCAKFVLQANDGNTKPWDRRLFFGVINLIDYYLFKHIFVIRLFYNRVHHNIFKF